MSGNYRNKVAIIAGQWRGTKLQVINVSGLRPTSARIRETVFNWLRDDIRDAVCLDLFAGSGALGFEAASRGAAMVTLVDQHPKLCQQLQATTQRLNTDRITVVRQDALYFLQTSLETFDLVFLDPPFDAKILGTVCQALEQRGTLSANAKIYIETARHAVIDRLPDNWRQLRSKTAGEVNYQLFQRQPVE